MTPAERAVARDMHSRGPTPAHIANQLGRNRSSITQLRALDGQDPRRRLPPSNVEMSPTIDPIAKPKQSMNVE